MEKMAVIKQIFYFSSPFFVIPSRFSMLFLRVQGLHYSAHSSCMIGAIYLASGNWNPICLPHLPACGQEIHYPFYFSPPSSPRLKYGTKDRRNRLLLSRRRSRRTKSKLAHSSDDPLSSFIFEHYRSNCTTLDDSNYYVYRRLPAQTRFHFIIIGMR